MASKSQPNNKFYFCYGHCKPSGNRPTVHSGFFSNRISINPNRLFKSPLNPNPNQFDFNKWDPNSNLLQTPSQAKSQSEKFFSVAQTLSPIARYICDSFRKSKVWSPEVVSDLNKLRRVTPQLVAEVLKVQTDPRLSSKFFHWAGTLSTLCGLMHLTCNFQEKAFNRIHTPKAILQGLRQRSCQACSVCDCVIVFAETILSKT